MNHPHTLLRPPISTPAPDFEAARMITYAEAASLLKVNKRTIRRRVADGRYIAYGDGCGKRLLYASILADIERTSGRQVQ
jgi:excisionase family DNA binding protein